MNNVGVDERSSPTHIFTVAELAQEANFAVFFKLIIASNSDAEPEDQSVESSIVF